MKSIEHDNQVCLFNWARLAAGKYPVLNLLYAIPNAGKRTLMQAVWLKREGLRPGVPDICLPVANKFHSALYVEMKSTKGRLTDNQKWWIQHLEKLGNKVEVCYSWVEAKDVILKYIERQ